MKDYSGIDIEINDYVKKFCIDGTGQFTGKIEIGIVVTIYEKDGLVCIMHSPHNYSYAISKHIIVFIPSNEEKIQNI